MILKVNTDYAHPLKKKKDGVCNSDSVFCEEETIFFNITPINFAISKGSE